MVAEHKSVCCKTNVLNLLGQFDLRKPSHNRKLFATAYVSLLTSKLVQVFGEMDQTGQRCQLLYGIFVFAYRM